MGSYKTARRWLFSTLVAAVFAGCGGGGNEPPRAQQTPEPKIVQPGEPGEPSKTLSPEEAKNATAIEPTQADVDFMQGMIHHHGQAILMTSWVPSRSDDRRVKLLAKRMGLSQEAEIELMEQWLQAEGVVPQDPNDHGDHNLMPGMLTQKQLDRLEAADGREFERLFLRYMTRHHQGALEMVQELRTSGGGLQSEIDKFAREVEADQTAEIQRMADLLAKR
jgi:uncharacterized protein (DUF305 family)